MATLFLCSQVYAASTVIIADVSQNQIFDGDQAEIAVVKVDDIDIINHVVRENETVTEIAEQYGLRTDTVLWANDITVDSPIKPGQELKILPFNGLVYTTSDGDTVSEIAGRFDADPKDIAEINGVAQEAVIESGSEIIVPRSFARGSYLLARGGQDESVIEDDQVDEDNIAREVSEYTVDESVEVAEEIAEQPTEADPAPAPGSSGWVCPAPGAVLTQGSHGSARGVDFGAPVGTSVVAADGGTVTKAAVGYNGGFGTVVEIDHHDGTTSLYAHLSTLLVSTGDNVSAGQALGYIGMTGRTSGPHLHFEIHGGSNPFAQMGYLSRCN